MPTPPALGFAKRLVTQVVDDEVPDLAAGLAYRFLFAIFPFAIFLAALAAFIGPALGMGDPTNQILGGLSDNLPPDVAEQIRPQLEAVLGTTRPGLLSIGAIAALWAATGGIGAVIGGMNKAYDVEETRGFIPKTGIALGLTILGSIGILAAFVTIVGGSVLTQEAVRVVGIGEGAWTAISLLRFPLVLGLVALAVAVLFKFGPNVSVSFRWTLVGGVVFAVGWLVATVLFGIYVANFASYSNTYGALGGVIVLMLWFYLTGLLLLVAAEVTALLAKEHEPHVIEARRTELREGASRTAKDAARAAGKVAGTAVGIAEAVTGADEPDATGVPEDRAPARPTRRAPAPRPAARPATRPGPNQQAGERPNGLAVAALLGVAAVGGALLGRIVGDGDRSG